jgi:hypothetical protein
MEIIVYGMGMIWTMRQTFTTTDASLWKILDLRTCLPPFWIMTPETLQRAAFKKYGCSNTGSIVNREALDIENKSLFA